MPSVPIFTVYLSHPPPLTSPSWMGAPHRNQPLFGELSRGRERPHPTSVIVRSRPAVKSTSYPTADRHSKMVKIQSIALRDRCDRSCLFQDQISHPVVPVQSFSNIIAIATGFTYFRTSVTRNTSQLTSPPVQLGPIKQNFGSKNVHH